MPQNHEDDLGNTNDQPNVEAASKDDWYKKPERPSIDFRPPQTLISKIAKVKKLPPTFDKLMSTPINFSAYFMNNLKIKNLTQEHLVGPDFNLLKWTCRSQVELEYNFKECYKAVIDRLDWTNLEGHEYPFDLSKPLPLIKVQGITHWGLKQQRFNGYASNRQSKHDVFSTKRIITVTHVKVMKWYDYGYLEEIVVQREDHQLYKFKEGDFPRLNLRDI
nr:hypothetical protein [Tanacetum cinerariifolium]